MNLAFSSKGLRDLCESHDIATAEIGENASAKLKRRLADLRAAPCANDLLIGCLAAINRNSHNRIDVALSDSCSIIISANHNTLPTLASGKIDWAKVTRVKILSIGGST